MKIKKELYFASPFSFSEVCYFYRQVGRLDSANHLKSGELILEEFSGDIEYIDEGQKEMYMDYIENEIPKD